MDRSRARSPSARHGTLHQASSTASMDKLPSDASIANVKVVCRVRPMNENEKKTGNVPVVTASSERKEVSLVRMVGGSARQSRSSYSFDEVLTSFSTQAEVFTATLQPLIGEVLAGYEATAFAYGQTGTGKTYTMEGDLLSEEGRGLVPRAAVALLEALASQAYKECYIHASYLEIYNEELSDLLVPANSQHKLELMDSGRGVCCNGLHEAEVSSIEEILDLVRAAQDRRRVAETRMNERSSRSHTIFTLKVRCRRTVSMGELENLGKLHLVDLAGSECAKKASISGAEDGASSTTTTYIRKEKLLEEERERRSINQSLLTLGRVIAALRSEQGRVPYRDSKLTRLLQDALGGRCKTVLIATISPALNAVEETTSTLSYAHQAAGIKNKPVAASLLKTFRDPKVQVEGSNFNENSMAELEIKVAYLQQEVEEAQRALARSYLEQKELNDRAEVAEVELNAKSAELHQARSAMEEMQKGLEGIGDRVHGLQSGVRIASNSLSGVVATADSAVKAGSTTAATVKSSAEARLTESLLEPCAAHAASMQGSIAAVEAHLHRAEALTAFCSTAAEATQARGEALQQSASDLCEGHSGTLSSFPARLETELSELCAAVSTCSGQIASVVDSLQSRMKNLMERMPLAMKEQRSHLCSLLQQADTDLERAWSVLLSELPASATVLEEVVASLQSGNASNSVEAMIQKASSSLQTSLSTELTELQKARDETAAEVAGLQRLAESERTAVSCLHDQRSALENQVDALSKDLQTLQKNLALSQTELTNIEASQAERRKRFLEAIVTAAGQEVALMESDLAAGTKAMRVHLQHVHEEATEVSRTLMSLRDRSAEQTQSAAAVVSAMGQTRELHCQNITNAQLMAEQSTHRVNAASETLHAEERIICQKVRDWGTMNTAVEENIADAQGKITAALTCQRTSQSQWASSCREVSAANDAWFEHAQKTLSDVQAAADDIRICGNYRCDLEDKVAKRSAVANAQLSEWLEASNRHQSSLEKHRDDCSAGCRAHCELESERLSEVDALQQEAGEGVQRASHEAADANAIVNAVKVHKMSTAAESAKIEASIDEVATQIDCVGGKAQDLFAELSSAMDDLSILQDGTALQVTACLEGRPIPPLPVLPAPALALGTGAFSGSATPHSLASTAVIDAESGTHQAQQDVYGFVHQDALQPNQTNQTNQLTRRPSRERVCMNEENAGHAGHATPTASSLRRTASGKLGATRQPSPRSRVMREVNAIR